MENSKNIVSELIGVDTSYDTIKGMDFSRGLGSNLSVKLVIPSFCQANCPFCFNHMTKGTQVHDYSQFFDNLDKSLELITSGVTERGISLNITGNEPTFNLFLLMKTMNHLKPYVDKFKRIILSTNGFRLYDSIEYLTGITNIVNISVHHYEYSKRKKIFGTASIPNDSELKEIVRSLHENGISTTAVNVLYQDVGDFREFYRRFNLWAKDIGFKNVRMRSNFCSDDNFFDDYLKIDFPKQNLDGLDALITKTITDSDGFETKLLKGVPDLTEYVIGAELVIDDDGKCYIDYNKRYPVDEKTIGYFNNFYIFNNNNGLTRKLTKGSQG